MMSPKIFAHSLTGRPENEWETLDAHLADVGKLAAAFCAKFGAEDWGRIAGRLHDIGKLSPEFQGRLRGATAPVDHATAGARISAERLGPFGRLLAYVIAGHHAGLANGTGDGIGGSPSPLDRRLDPQRHPIPRIDGWEALCNLPSQLSLFAATTRHDLTGAFDRLGLSYGLRTRMVYSALVDADRLATEAFYRKAADESAAPRGTWRDLNEFKIRLDAFMEVKGKTGVSLASSSGQCLVNQERAGVLAAARAAAGQTLGLFSLTVPTGGGKTLASLTFALDHAVKHKLDRVIYVIPFTSIIEQTACVFREALGAELADHIIEHHSAFREDEALAALENSTGGESALQAGERLQFATENWDAPIIVTTAVQFFESLFSNRPTRCRKLHNIARSVVIMDEAQTLPLRLLRPTLAAIEELTSHYQTTAVLCTATQPAVGAKRADGREKLRGGLIGVREIIEQPRRLYETLARVTVAPCRSLSQDALVEELARLDRALCIVGTRTQARELFKKLGEAADKATTFHLSALMCPAHRTQKLTQIREALAGGSARVVATTVVEAGVDIDFPAVWRQMAGLDSIAQAAGRCNREGRLARNEAIVQLFEVEGWNSIRELRPNEAAAREVLRRGFDDLLGLDAIEAYFDHLYWQAAAGQTDGLDTLGILPAFQKRAHEGWLPFADVARDYRLIESVMEPVIVPWDLTAREAVAALGASSLSPDGIRAAARKLQPYIVNVPKDVLTRLKQAGRIESINPHRFEEQFLCLGEEARDNIYTDELGLDWSDETFRKAEANLM